MTTIVVDKNKIAHDARATTGGGRIATDEFGKSIGFNGDVYIGVGSSSGFFCLMYLLIHGKPHPRWTDTEKGVAIVSRHDGAAEVVYVDKDAKGKAKLCCSPITVHPTAFGSGGDWALAALDMGRDTVEAVEYAMERDSCSGGEVTVLDRFREERIADYNLNWISGGSSKTLLAEQLVLEGHSQESLYDSDEITLLDKPPIWEAELFSVKTISRVAKQLSDDMGSFFSTIAENWAFEVAGDVNGISKSAYRRDFTDWANMQFYKPMGLTTDLLSYLKTLEGILDDLSGLKSDVLTPTSKFIRKSLGERDAVMKITTELDAIDAANPNDLRTRIGEHIDSQLTNNRCRITDLVGRNKDWIEVENTYNRIIKKFKALDAKDIPSIAQQIGNDLIRLIDDLEQQGDVKSQVGVANIKALISRVEHLAGLVDVVGAVGYLIQSMETSLRLNNDIFKEA